MNDRELLELAAKAVGIKLGGETDSGFAIEIESKPYVATWNPLTDDGDALRLAVKLGEKFQSAFIGIFNRAAAPHVCASVTHVSGTETYVEDDVGDDIYAATRRAIVRAAAEIGRQMQEGGAT